jgi:PAT family beta-lactamase induction signal transducer AmpG
VLAGVPTGFMAKTMGWPMFYTASVLGAVPGIVLLTRFAPWKNRSAGQ